MAITNIRLARTIAGEKVRFQDISLGFQVTFPTGDGVKLIHECTELDETTALFVSTDSDWPSSWIVSRNAQDLNYKEFKMLSEALDAYSGDTSTPDDSQRALVNRAKSLGYVSQVDHVQAIWTDYGAECVVALEKAMASVLEDPDFIDPFLRSIVAVEDYYELADVIGDMRPEEKLEALKSLLTPESLGIE